MGVFSKIKMLLASSEILPKSILETALTSSQPRSRACPYRYRHSTINSMPSTAPTREGGPNLNAGLDLNADFLEEINNGRVDCEGEIGVVIGNDAGICPNIEGNA